MFTTPTQWLSRFSDYLTTSIKVLFTPCKFFTQTLTGGAINPLAHQLPARDKLTEFLTIAVLIATLAAPMHHWLLTESGFDHKLLELTSMDQQKLADNYQKMTAQPLTVINLNSLTGIQMIDSPIADSIKLLSYLLLGMAFWIFSRGKLPAKSVMVYFIYAFGACLGLETLLVLSHDMMVLTQHKIGQAYNLADAAQTGNITSLPRILLLFIMPAVIFPKLYEVSAGEVVKVTFMAVIALGLSGITASQAMLTSGLIVIFPGF